jgi:hypothetical protein
MPINYQKTYDSLSYEEGVEFCDLTIEVMKEIYPHYVIHPAEPQNPWLIYIVNQDDNIRIQFPLRDLYNRFVRTARTRADLKDTILNDFSHTLKLIDKLDIEDLDKPLPTWAEICDSVHPRLTTVEDLPGDLDLFVNLPFGEGVITAFVIYNAEQEMIKWIQKEMLEKWNITFDDLYKKAMENFADLTEGMELVGSGKPHAYLWNEKGQDFSATAMLLGGMRYLIAQTIGSPFRFGIPSGLAFFCWTELDDEQFQIESKAMIKRKYETMPARLSTNIYEVDENGQIKQIKNLPEIPDVPNFSNN